MNRRSFLRSLAAAPVAAVVPATSLAAPSVFKGGYTSHGEVLSLINENETIFRGYEASRIRASLALARMQMVINGVFVDADGRVRAVVKAS